MALFGFLLWLGAVGLISAVTGANPLIVGAVLAVIAAFGGKAKT